MTAGLGDGRAGSSALDQAAVRSLLAAFAVAAGLVLAWLADGSVVVLAVLAVLLAASNGYGKAYSP
jgi:hypothetical protein